VLTFDNTYVRLPERFHAHVRPATVRAPRLLALNQPLARLLGADPAELSGERGAALLSGNELFPGHQFGSFVHQLGDGRAILLGEVVGTDAVRRDVQLKGSGRTPFSRGGDGKAAIGPVLREYLVSEAMFALGIPTTRSLAAVATGEPVMREEVLPGAVLTRVATSHLRVGTFEYFAARGDVEALRELTAYALARHYPDATGSPAIALLDRVVAAQAGLVAKWLGVGFVHGVMNTDNTSIAGETIDYGPCAFLDAYDPGRAFSSIDRGGRYAFANQPRIALWNCARLAEALLPLIGDDQDEAAQLATASLDRYGEVFNTAYRRIARAKMGVAIEEEEDLALWQDLLGRMAAAAVDHTLFFRRLCDAAEDASHDARVAELFDDPAAFGDWAARWRARGARDPLADGSRAHAMRRANPAFIPRNHRVEEALRAAADGDLGPFETLARVLARPYEDQPDAAHLMDPPGDEQRGYRTFCGT
jgi:uncharacterized protein YdiU (UPF0061 family)